MILKVPNTIWPSGALRLATDINSVINRAAMGRARFLIYPWFIFNRAAMGRARFLIYPWFIFFFLCRLNQTSLGQNSSDAIFVGGFGQIVFGTLNHATCDVYSPKAVETLIEGIYLFRFSQHLFCIYLEGMSELTSLMMNKIVLICKCFFARTHGR